MNPKEYTIGEDTTLQVAEPVALYGSYNRTAETHLYSPTQTEMASLKRSEEQLARGEYYTEEEVDKMVNEWLN